MRIIDTSEAINACYGPDGFEMNKWKAYIGTYVPGAGELCLEDMQECLDAGFLWDSDYLPVLNGVMTDQDKREKSIGSFHEVTGQLDQRIMERFDRAPDCDLILYLGLCNGAGWVTEVNGRRTVLFGLEKIMELNWQDIDSMRGLVTHELGHVYQDEFGVLEIETKSNRDHFIWQLFTEGIAMVFEQELAGDSEHFHQYDDEWKEWCDKNFILIRDSFRDDLETMTPSNQCYFGDWVSFLGHGDTGYYLGARFVRFLMSDDDFDKIISYDLKTAINGFERFVNAK